MDKQVFMDEIKRLLLEAKIKQLEYIELSAGKIHRNVGGYPGPMQHIELCCEAMCEIKSDRDEIVQMPHRGKGATLKIKYYL